MTTQADITAFAARIPATRSTRSASRSAASSRPTDCAAAAMAASRCGAAASAAISAASRSRGEVVLHQPDARRRRVRARRHWRIGPDRARAAAAPGSTAGRSPQARRRSKRRSARSTRWLAAMRAGRSAKNGATSAATDELGIGLAHAGQILLARLLDDRRAARRRPASSRPIAAGTISAMTRAPWLPPKMRSRNGSPGAG